MFFMDYLKFERDINEFSEKAEFNAFESNCIKEFAKNLIEGTKSFDVEYKRMSDTVRQKIWNTSILRKEFQRILLRYDIKEEIFN